jgi:two-component system response regulator FixJ
MSAGPRAGIHRTMVSPQPHDGHDGRALVGIVEDDKAVLHSLQFTLEAEGWEVCAFERALDALNSLRILDAKCLVIDYALPDFDGVTLLNALRARGQEAPAVIIASTPSVRCRLDAAAAGAPLIEKPLMGDYLNRRIAEMTGA